MRVALFASAFHPHVGGVEELCRQVAHEYHQRGWEVCVITNRWPRDLPERENVEGTRVYRLPLRTPDAGWKSRLSFGMTTGAVRREVVSILRRRRVDLLHVHCVSGNGHYALRAARTLRLPLVTTLHGELTMDASRLFERSAFARRTLREVLRESGAVTACSQQTLQEAERFFGAPLGGRARVIRSGIRYADFAGVTPWTHPRKYVLGIGRQVPQKGFDLLIRAMAQLWAAGHAVGDLVLAGDGPERDRLVALAEKLGVASRVIFTGTVGRRQAAALFAGCEFFVLPSRHEPLGIVNLEAMASGKPVLATHVGGVPEIVRHGETGWLVPPEDSAALAAGILLLARDTALCARLSAGGRRVAREHDWDILADEYEAVYRAILPARCA